MHSFIPSPTSASGDDIEIHGTAKTALPIRVTVLLTCFNRKQHTMDCFSRLAKNTDLDHVRVDAVLVDDGSTDGTAEAVRESFPWVQVVHDNGNLFWCRGMHRAFAIAQESDPDYFLWLNDDTTLRSDAIARLLACEATLRSANGKPVIVVGTTVDATTGAVTYGGERRAPGMKRSRFLRVLPSDVPQLCDSMNGNIVLISREAALIVGNVDPAFEHAMGDTDYALRARKLGVEVWLGPGLYGECGGNAQTGTYMDPAMPLARRWKQMMSRKGLPWRSWLVLTRRHMGPLWPLYFGWPYLSLLIGKYGRKGGR